MVGEMMEARNEVIVAESREEPSGLPDLAVFPAARSVAEAFSSEVALDPADVRDRVERLLAQMLAHGMTAEMPLQHVHAGDLYARELSLPKGTFAIGEIQKFPHVSVLLQGEISMLNEHGGITRLKAPCTFASKPGARKVGLVHEDVIWTTVHCMRDSGIADTSSAPVEQLESFLVARTQEEFALFLQSQPLIEVSP